MICNRPYRARETRAARRTKTTDAVPVAGDVLPGDARRLDWWNGTRLGTLQSVVGELEVTVKTGTTASGGMQHYVGR